MSILIDHVFIRTSSSNPSHIYADDFAEDPDCSSRNMNKVALRHGKCGMSTEKTVRLNNFSFIMIIHNAKI
uniref:ZP domain-containing protein n=1 Tax=Heterorhabditis bacteriophora TaxID=37862 RepID=A0A1I7WWK8_HETBA